MTQPAQQVNLLSSEFQPKNEYILVKPEEIKQQTEKTLASGLILAIQPKSTLLTRPTSGPVVAVGSDIEDIKEGDFILWPGTDGLDLEFIDGIFTLLRYKSVIGSKK
jgi:co-chaperonin GroES (HSP10)